ncbi:MAG TPA: ABC transporter ATP-binding protein [Acidimicrobiales bacterium]
MSNDSAIDIRGVAKSFAGTTVLHDINLEIRDGEFFTMLGPSGSGKTTLLRMVAGFETPDVGTIKLHGDDVTQRPAHVRPVNTVFQDYALFPHMDVVTNVEYGLRVAGVKKEDRRRRASDALAMVQLEGFAERRPAQLSGGQRQRVALARAIVNEPSVLLLDEPLGALDLKLRQEMQTELKAIQRRIGITFLYVTHDQEEAMAMSDRIAIMNRGVIEQVGSPKEIYELPASAFVASFIGTSNVIVRSGRTQSLRPERLRLLPAASPAPEGTLAESGSVVDVVYLGPVTRVYVHLASGDDLVAVRTNDALADESQTVNVGDSVVVAWRPEDAFDLESELV